MVYNVIAKIQRYLSFRWGKSLDSILKSSCILSILFLPTILNLQIFKMEIPRAS